MAALPLVEHAMQYAAHWQFAEFDDIIHPYVLAHRPQNACLAVKAAYLSFTEQRLVPSQIPQKASIQQ